MSYADLAEKLKSVGKQLAAESSALDGKKLAASAGALKRALDRFSRDLETLTAGNDPAIAEFGELIQAPAARKHLDLDSLKRLAKEILGKTVPAKKEETALAYKKRLIEAIDTPKLAAKALKALREFLADSAVAAPQIKNEEALLAELYRIGGLDDTEIEATARLRDEKLLRALAAAARIRVRETSSLDKIRRDVVQFAKRAHKNLG